MKKLLSIRYSAAAFNVTMFILRVGLATLMIPHGYDKLVHFEEYKKNFMDFLGTGSTISLAMVVFSEFFCSLLVMLGLFSRVAAVILIFEMGVVVFIAHKGEIFGDGEHGSLFILGFLCIALLGPGRISVDGMISK